MPVYLPMTSFSEREYYSVTVDQAGVTVYSECCGDTMTARVARLLHEALGRYLAGMED